MGSLADPRVSNQVLAVLKIKPEDKIIFIRENSFADSNFIITHLLKQLLYEKSRVCFLTLHNTLEHYQQVGKKLQYDLNQAVQKGDVKVIDPLEELVDNIGQDLEDQRTNILHCIFNSAKAEIDSFLAAQDHPLYVIIDDMSHFLDLGVELSELINFTNRCLNLTSNKNVFAIINSHVSSKTDLILANGIQYVCDVLVTVSPLKTGRSTDITGLMSVQRGREESRYHFKAFDRGVKTFRPGESIYNLYK